MSSYQELADYLVNLANLIQTHSRLPKNTLTAEDAARYLHAFTTVGPAVTQYLESYNPSLPSLSVTPPLTRTTSVKSLPGTPKRRPGRPKGSVSPRTAAPKEKHLKHPPPLIKLQHRGKNTVDGVVKHFTVIHVEHDGREVTVKYDDGTTETFDWRRPGRWVTHGMLGKNFKGDVHFNRR